jgi:hypothetical protein
MSEERPTSDRPTLSATNLDRKQQTGSERKTSKVRWRRRVEGTFRGEERERVRWEEEGRREGQQRQLDVVRRAWN